MKGPSTFWDHNFLKKYLLLYYIHMDNALPTTLNVRAPSFLDGVFPYLKESPCLSGIQCVFFEL